MGKVMKTKWITALVLIAGAIVLLALWGYARTGWDHTVRLQLVLHGLPFSLVRDDPVGSRPNGMDHHLAYRRSVYSLGGEYVGYIERFGQYVPLEKEPNTLPMVLVAAIYHWAQYLSAVLLLVGILVLWIPSKIEKSQQSHGEMTSKFAPQ